MTDAAQPVELIIKLAPAAATPGSTEHRAVQACVAQEGISIRPLDESRSDAELTTYFIALVDPAMADRMIGRLLNCAGVESAYMKPSGEPPR